MLEIPRKALEYFPYTSVRPLQDEFIEAIYEAISERKSILIEGSNGLGKTVSALSACLPIAKENNLRIIYLAKTHRQHDRVIEELRAISKKQQVSGVSIRGRSEMCLHPFVLRHAKDPRSIMETCRLLKARHECPYYSKIEEEYDLCAEVLAELLRKPLKASEVSKICKSQGLCPYELTKLMLEEVDVIALSYLYIFDPVIRNAFFKRIETPLEQFILVVDEAHNLPETAIEIASDELSLFTIKMGEKEAREHGYEDIAIFCRRLHEIIERMAEAVKDEAQIPPKFFLDLLEKKADVEAPLTFFEELLSIGEIIRHNLLSKGKYPRSYIHRIASFLSRWFETREEKAYTHVISKYLTKAGKTSAKLEIVALDPAKITEPVFSNVYTSVVMSGTLEPLEAYMQVTAMPENTILKAVSSPFPPEHVLALVCKGVTTAMKKRTKEMYHKLAKRIAEAARYTPANIGVFTASFDVLEGLLSAGLEEMLEKPLFYERKGMKSKENEQLIRRFKGYAKHGGAVLLGVQGGRSSEGVDYPGDEMNTVVIVGVPYAEPTPRVKAQISYYESRFPGKGREYGYILPALKKASQAAGRPIRTLEDRGAIIFLDYRFATAYCQRFLPRWIRRNMKTLPDKDGSIAKELMLFFGYFRERE
ncbi:ATP-dependent DNA helicase [Candidatus Bathyarchaeota archaeon]|nr:ATP-dependent DNA helicase [Candidatus Bathyarchaeota archaeon]